MQTTGPHTPTGARPTELESSIQATRNKGVMRQNLSCKLPEQRMVWRLNSGCSSRCLLRMLQPLMPLEGLWKASSTEQHPATSASDDILAFKWTPAALVCLQLKGTQPSRDSSDLFWNVVSVLGAKSILPRVLELSQGIIAVLPVRILITIPL